MADLEEQFQKAAENVKKLKKSPTDMELLELYGSFKQATVGDINPNESAPAFYKMKELAKHKAWKAQTGKSKGDAMKAYVDLANKLIETYGLN